MAAPAIGRRPRFAPGPTTRVDWSHPVAQGLGFCTLDGTVDIAYGIPITQNNAPDHGLMPTGRARSYVGASTQYSSFPAAPSVQSPTQVSIVVWMQRTNGNVNVYVGQDINANRVFTFDGASATRFYVNGGGGTDIVTGATNISGSVSPRPRMIAGTATSGASINVYVDGVLDGTASPCTFNATQTADWNIGRRAFSGAENYVTGTIGPVMIWRRALTASEIALLYADPFCFLRS
jgi:hypothetical protein